MSSVASRIGAGAAVWLGRRVAALSQPASLRLGRAVGDLVRIGSPGRRAVVQANLDACFPALDPMQRRQLLREAFCAAGCGLVESTRAWWTDDAQLALISRVSGLQHLAMAGDQGVLVLVAHYTPIELICRLLNQRLQPPAAMLVRRHNNPHLEARIDAARRRHAVDTIEKKDMRAALRHLRGGGRLIYAPDQNFSYRSVFAPFFGVPAATVTATAELVSRTGAVLVPVWGHRDEAGHYQVQVEAAWTDFPTGEPLADAARINDWIEQRVREHPEQYLWLHRRFRTRPAGEPPFYPRRGRRAKHR